MSTSLLRLRNGESALLRNLPIVSEEIFRENVLSLIVDGARIAAWFGLPSESHNDMRLIAVLACDAIGDYVLLGTKVGTAYPSLTPDCPQVHLFEREFAEKWNIHPVGHPWLKAVRFPVSADGYPGEMNFFQVEGANIHEVAVGPVHAGIIEPGHFRFNCQGETVHHLEISLGYQHRGIERALVGGPDKRTIHYIETAAGDTTIGHALAYAQLTEALSGVRVTSRAEQLRGLGLELERLANHTGDLGALAGDIGFLPTASFCGRLRGEYLNLTALLCGNRFGRGLVKPGGVAFDMNREQSERLLQKLEVIFSDTRHAVELLWKTPSVMARFENTGVLSRGVVVDLGLVGVVSRASGVDRDVRLHHPHGVYLYSHLPVSIIETGDVFARAYVRWLEMQRSCAFITDTVMHLRKEDPTVVCGSLASESIAISATEAWRGEVFHIAVTGNDGRFIAYEIIDPSFHNWMGLALAMRGEAISDFPLCNKSFNLSYCGHDL
ncbi:MAG: hypothetical protein JW963_06925 [Anaerolineales bacterium]|nr:hypothetical protein [Anaerolineales bacterium]